MKVRTSKARKEVWQMKRLAQKETQHLKGAEYFAYVRQRVTDAYPFPLRHVRLTPDEPAASVMMACDGHREYRTRRRGCGKG
jgi:hypothetical protein